MDIKEWLDYKKSLKKDKITASDLARIINKSPAFITQLSKGKRRASPDTALKICEITKSEVSLLSLLFPAVEERERVKRLKSRAFTLN